MIAFREGFKGAPSPPQELDPSPPQGSPIDINRWHSLSADRVTINVSKIAFDANLFNFESEHAPKNINFVGQNFPKKFLKKAFFFCPVFFKFAYVV